MNLRLLPAPLLFSLALVAPPVSGGEDTAPSVWIEETGTVARVLLKTPTQTQQLVEAARGELLDATHSLQGGAWSKWNGKDWDIQVWKAGHVETLGETGRDDGQPVVWEGGVAWISADLMDIRVVLKPWTGPSRVLPGALAENLACDERGLSWMSQSPTGPKSWLLDEQGPRQIKPEVEALADTHGDRTIEAASGEWTPCWEQIETQGPPSPRTTHATLQLSPDKLLVFGGEVWDESCTHFLGFDNALWILDPITREWRQTVPDPSPRKRCHTPLAFAPSERIALLWGGGGLNAKGEIELLGDTWLLDTETPAWTKISTPVQPRNGADPAIVHDPALNRFLFFRRGETWEFRIAAKQWTRLNLPHGPAPREAATVALDATTRKILFFGGNAGSRYFDDTWILDLHTGRWRPILEDPHPSARVRAAHAVDPDRRIVALYGGVRGPHSKRKSDLWVFDFECERWSRVACEGAPNPGRRGGFHGMGFDPSSGLFTLFGGRADSVRHHNDVWRLKLGRGKP